MSNPGCQVVDTELEQACSSPGSAKEKGCTVTSSSWEIHRALGAVLGPWPPHAAWRRQSSRTLLLTTVCPDRHQCPHRQTGSLQPDPGLPVPTCSPSQPVLLWLGLGLALTGAVRRGTTGAIRDTVGHPRKCSACLHWAVPPARWVEAGRGNCHVCCACQWSALTLALGLRCQGHAMTPGCSWNKSCHLHGLLGCT